MDPDSYRPDYEVIRKIYEYQDLYDDNPDTDLCLEDIVDLTKNLVPKICYIRSDCWTKYFGYDSYATGYVLTHK